MQIAQRTIWLTGASSGIGKALAFQLADGGAKLILSARSEDKLDALKAKLPRTDEHIVVPMDLTNSASLPETVAGVLSKGVKVDMLINNGGISQRGTAKDTDMAVFREVMEVNYFGTIALTKALLPELIKQQGMVVTIASVAGKVGGQGMSGYAGSKHAIIGYMDCLRAEEAANGLQVLTVCPGFVQTNISLHARTEDGSEFGQMADSIAEGISADSCAASIIKAIQGDKKEVVIGKGLSAWAPTIKRLFPNLFMRLSAAKDIR